MAEFAKNSFINIVDGVPMNDYNYISFFYKVHDYNYAHAVVSYLKARGCRIVNTSYSIVDDKFYIMYQRTDKMCNIDAGYYADSYMQKGGIKIHIDSFCKQVMFWLPVAIIGLWYLYTIGVN